MSEVELRDAMVLAAGLGTRLRPLTDELPKPAVPVLNRPLAAFSLDHLSKYGVRSIGFNTHHLPLQLRAALEPQVPPGIRSVFVHEADILGTGGGIRNVWRALGEPDPFLVLNGDVLFQPDLAGALAHHVRLGAMATMVLREVADPERFGAVEVDATGQVRRLLGQPTVAAAALRKLMFTGVQILSARAIASLPERGCVVRQGYRPWIDAGEVVAGFVDSNSWLELGTPVDYALAQLALLAEPAGLLGPVAHPTGLVDREAVVGVGTTLRACVVGARAQVAAGVTLERVILWPGAIADHDLRDTIVTSQGRLVSWL